MSQEKLKTWAEANNASLVVYGSRQSDIDYRIFLPPKVFIKDPKDLFSGDLLVYKTSILAIEEDGSLVDLSITYLPMKAGALALNADMLRNSEPAPEWILDGAGARGLLEKWILENPRLQASADLILREIKNFCVNVRFVEKKCFGAGPLHGRWLVAHAIEPYILNLVREWDLRRGGKGKWKGRDFEKILTPGQLRMATVNYPLDQAGLIEACVFSRFQVRYWLAELGIPEPEELVRSLR